MLETILQSINSNLERIAKAQEETLNLKKASIVVTMGNTEEGGTYETTVNSTPQQVQPVTEQPQAVVHTQTVPTAPVQTEIPQAQTTIPVAQAVQSFTQEQLAVAMSNAVSAGKTNVIQGILQQFGVQALTQINPNDYNKVATMLKEAGVEV